ncbi:Uncharacterized protein PECH_002621 [Penicillium ucsense]|uniref:Potassium channel domain-containing protein n=1 Tax=Penicillium ucsense TaxID=2839758 RepID=A0A8J8VY06_9EURO|nr:Uncharacterized protein PECM_002165 [Penicillium ucsense]KAF7730628.1 Uncharacterized protein PECH_002621 [Penicillium ucsense]
MGYALTAVGWLISAIILFALLGIDIRRHQQEASHEALIYTESFFAAVFAACIYALVSILLLIHALPFCTRSEHRKVVECTSTMLRLTIFAILLLGGAAVYSKIEGWTLIDALYFTDYTVLTIGLGNVVPNTHLGRSLLFPYATLGIISLGLVVAAVMSVTDQLRELRLAATIDSVHGDLPNMHSEKRPAKRTVSCGSKFQGSFVSSVTQRYTIYLKEQEIQARFYRRSRWIDILLFMSAWFMLWLVSAAVFRHSEKESNWSYFIALYFTYTSLTTIGYGDYYPTSNFGKVFFIFWSLLAIPILTNLVTLMGGVFHTWLRYLSGCMNGHVWHRNRTEELNHETMHYSRLKGKDVQIQTSYESCEMDIERCAPDGPSSSSRYLQSVPPMNTISGRSTTEEIDPADPRRAMTQQHLMVLEEIQNLITLTREDRHRSPEKLCCRWSRVVPLLRAQNNSEDLEGLVSLFASARSATAPSSTAKDSKHEREVRNMEILWMVSLLVERLSVDLRHELSRPI